MTEPALPPRFDRLLEYVPYHAQRRPDRLALVGDHRALTWSELEQLSDRLGRALIRNGVDVGDRVAAWFPPSVEGLLLFVACLRVGAMFVGINPKAKLEELRHIFSDSGPTLVFAFDRTDERDYRPDIARFREAGFSGRCIVLTHGGDGIAGLEPFLRRARRTKLDALAR